MYRLIQIMVLCALIGSAPGCAPLRPSVPPPAAAGNQRVHDIAGVWKGTVRSWYETRHGANAIRKITLNITQQGTELRGTYECFPGNAMCHNRDVVGVIRWGTIKGNEFWCVIRRRPDFSLCVYKGFLGDYAGSGNMWCYADSGGLEEVGLWKLRRAAVKGTAPDGSNSDSMTQPKKN